MKGTTIILNRDLINERRAITKITPLSDGFAIMVPYHTASSCFLIKTPVNYSLQEEYVAFSDCTTFEARSRVKLSVHFPGFAQFSGEDSSKIISGRNPITGEPRGMGIVNNGPFDIISGPVAIIGFWGSSDFSLTNKSQSCIDLYESRCMYRHYPRRCVNDFMIEVWMVRSYYKSMIADYLGQPMIRFALPQFSGLEILQDLYVIDLPGQSHFLGVQLVRCMPEDRSAPDSADWSPPASGFSLNGPSAMDDKGQYWGLRALFPRPHDFPQSEHQLDR